MQYAFGIGNLFALRTDVSPVLAVPFGNIQDVQFDFSFEEKELYGQFQFPVDIARAKGKITGKAKFAHINAALFNSLFFGGTLATGQTHAQNNEPHTVPASPYTVTITPPSSGTIVDDLGVVYALTGIPLTRVTSAPTTGQYSYAAGVYTFAAGDTTISMYISYSYLTSAVGNTITYANQLMGAAPKFQIVWGNTYGQKDMFYKFNSCISTKFNMPMKVDDYTVPEFDFSAFSDASGNIFSYSGAE